MRGGLEQDREFHCEAFGKWILAGEHSVLRGSPALVFPLRSSSLKLSFFPSSEPLHVDFLGSRGEEMRLLFWGVLESALERLHVDRSLLRGQVKLQSELQVGAGLGASAALCVAVSRWCADQGWIEPKGLYDFARSLENLFHGESSGVDVAMALRAEPLRFLRSGETRPLALSWQPEWGLSYCGQRGVTSECVRKVQMLEKTQPDLFESLDEQMSQAVELAERALWLPESEESLGLLIQSLDLASDCFEQWGLTSGKLGEHMQDLRRQGALAVKPTGSGGGGFVLSLWSKGTLPEGLGLLKT